MSDYKLGMSDSYVIRTADGATIPNSDVNPDWLAYQAWVKQGGKPDPFQSATEKRDMLMLAVDSERDRRLYAGVTFEGNTYDSDAVSRQNVSDAGRLAFMSVMGGSLAGDLRWATPDQDFAWISASNAKVLMDAPTMVNLSRAMVASKNNLTMAARALKDMAVIPADYADDKWWT